MNSHRRNYPYCTVSYWMRTNSMSRASTESGDWTHCVVGPVRSGHTYGEQTFTRDQEYQRDSLIHLLQTAYEAGQEDAKAEIRKVLGVK